jgi:3-mercaptopyruvate sulfurtransferase SseA
MRSLTAVVIASVFAAGLASAQLKVQQQSTTAATGSNTLTPQPVAQQPLESARRINRDEAIKLVKHKKAVFVDVRSKESYEAGHIEGAMSIPESELISRLREIPPHRMIITYCA